MSDIDVTIDPGPLFEVKVEKDSQQFTLQVGAKTSSLFGNVSASDTVDVLITATEVLGLFRAVTISGTLCDPTDADLNQYAGVTKVSMIIGASDFVVRSGLITEASWTWTTGSSIFVGANGILTQTPTALPLRRIGWAISATQINLDPFPIIGG